MVDNRSDLGSSSAFVIGFDGYSTLSRLLKPDTQGVSPVTASIRSSVLLIFKEIWGRQNRLFTNFRPLTVIREGCSKAFAGNGNLEVAHPLMLH